MQTVTFIVPGEPASKSRPRFSRRGGKVVTYTPDAIKAAERAIGFAYRAASNGSEVTTGEFAVTCLFRLVKRQRRDVDNMVKLVLDGLNGLAFDDDVQVMRVTAAKEYVTRNAETRVTVRRLGDAVPAPSVPCEQCGTLVRVYPSSGRRRFCSKTCENFTRTEGRTHVCRECGTTFTHRRPSDSPTYCSVTCKSNALSVPFVCSECGEQMMMPQSVAARRKTCSRQCAAMRSARVRRENQADAAPPPLGEAYGVPLNPTPEGSTDA